MARRGTTSRSSTRGGSPGETVRRGPTAGRGAGARGRGGRGGAGGARRSAVGPAGALAPDARVLRRAARQGGRQGRRPAGPPARATSPTWRWRSPAPAPSAGARCGWASPATSRRCALWPGGRPGPRPPLPPAPDRCQAARRHRPDTRRGCLVGVRRSGLDGRRRAPGALAAGSVADVRRHRELAADLAAVGSAHGPEDAASCGARCAGAARPAGRGRRRRLTALPGVGLRGGAAGAGEDLVEPGRARPC